MNEHRKEFWKTKELESERLARLEKWERLFAIRIFPEILLRR